MTKLRSAGLPAETLPGPPIMPPGLTPLELSQRGRRLAQAGVIGVREGPSDARPRDAWRCCSTRSAARSTPHHGLRRPTVFQWEFTDPDVPTWHLTVEQRLLHRRAGRRAARRRAPADRLPGLRRHRRRPPHPAARARHRPHAPPRQPARAQTAHEGLPAGLSGPGRPGIPRPRRSTGESRFRGLGAIPGRTPVPRGSEGPRGRGRGRGFAGRGWTEDDARRRVTVHRRRGRRAAEPWGLRRRAVRGRTRAGRAARMPSRAATARAARETSCVAVGGRPSGQRPAEAASRARAPAAPCQLHRRSSSGPRGGAVGDWRLPAW